MRIFNNYDGYMYTVHNLKIGEINYKQVMNNLENEIESNELLALLVEKKILMVIDAFDVKIIGSKEVIIEKFENFNSINFSSNYW